jgi:hypothetical protein
MQSLFAYIFRVNHLKYYSSRLDITILSTQIEEIEITRGESTWGTKSKGNVVIKKKKTEKENQCSA